MEGGSGSHIIHGHVYKHVVWSGEMRGSHWIFPARVYRTRLDRYECWHVICAQSEPVFTSI